MKRTLILQGVVLLFPLVLSCGVTSPDPKPGSGRGSVALFISDNISFYQQVVSTVTGVRLINSGTGDVCTVLRAPVTYDLSNLTSMAQYSDLTECPEGRYNRVDIDVRKDVQVRNQVGEASACSFTSYLDEGGRLHALACDEASGTCTLSVRGGSRDGFLHVQADQYNDVGVDFDLKKFRVAGFGDPSSCAVTMAASLMTAADMNESGRAHSVTGSISGLDTASGTFTLTASGLSLTVGYGSILPSLQPGIDHLLNFAQSEGLRVNVLTGDIDAAARRIPAKRIFVKASGTATGVLAAPAWSFSLEYQPGKTMIGSQKPPAVVQGTFVDNAWVNVKFDGYDQARDAYVASSIEILSSGTVLDD